MLIKNTIHEVIGGTPSAAKVVDPTIAEAPKDVAWSEVGKLERISRETRAGAKVMALWNNAWGTANPNTPDWTTEYYPAQFVSAASGRRDSVVLFYDGDTLPRREVPLEILLRQRAGRQVPAVSRLPRKCTAADMKSVVETLHTPSGAALEPASKRQRMADATRSTRSIKPDPGPVAIDTRSSYSEDWKVDLPAVEPPPQEPHKALLGPLTPADRESAPARAGRGFTSALGLRHSWTKRKRVPSKNIVVAAYVLV